MVRSSWRMSLVVGMVIGGFLCGTLGMAPAAESDTKVKKPKTSQEPKAAKPKGEKPKFKTAETAGKATACFGVAPKIDKVSPDEGKPGDKVTITGANFGSTECLRSVSFGPGHTATFKMESATKITATVPSGGRKGLAILTVTTASGEDSKPFLVK
ncbi:MAG TPA: IPT/TIG domain-containing protein [Nitrospiraceae bacterium]|nr:IPT/TIG domain-containing protein [Nitrospiraceae bacterium]